DVEAQATVDDLVLHGEERLGELAHLLDGPLEQEEREPLGRLRSDPGQPLERLDEPRDRVRIVRQAGSALHPQAGNLEPAGEPAELLLHELARLPQRLVARGKHEVLQHLDVVAVHHLGIDLDRDDLLLAVRLDRHHAAAGRRLHPLLADLFLHRGHLLLQFLRFLHDVPEALHWPSPSGGRGRTATTSPWNSAIAAWTAGCSPAPPALSPAATTVIRSAPATWRRTACTTISRFAVSASVSRWKWFPVRTMVSSPSLTPPGRAWVSTVPSMGRFFMTSSSTRGCGDSRISASASRKARITYRISSSVVPSPSFRSSLPSACVRSTSFAVGAAFSTSTRRSSSTMSRANAWRSSPSRAARSMASSAPVVSRPSRAPANAPTAAGVLTPSNSAVIAASSRPLPYAIAVSSSESASRSEPSAARTITGRTPGSKGIRSSPRMCWRAEVRASGASGRKSNR